MKLPRLLLVMLSLVAASMLSAADEATSRMKYAFDQLRANGGVAFANALYPEATPESDALGVDVDRLARPLGVMLDYEIVARTQLTKRLERFVVAVHHVRGPYFVRIDSYANESSWFFLPARVSPDASAILPDELLDVAGR